MELSKTETEAVGMSLGPVGEYVALVGMDKPLKDYTKDEALRLVAVAYMAVRGNIHKVLQDTVLF